MLNNPYEERQYLDFSKGENSFVDNLMAVFVSKKV